MHNFYYILDDDRNPIPASGVREWARFCEGEFRRVDKTKIGPVEVSTIFIGLDMNASIHGGPPHLFETMIFEGPYSGAQFRVPTWDQAQQTHDRCVQEFVLDITNPIPYILWEIDQWLKPQYPISLVSKLI